MQVSQEAWIFLGIETFLFLVLLYSLFRANRKLQTTTERPESILTTI